MSLTEFKSAKCPSCGGSLQVPDDRERVKCMYCGNDIVVKEAVAAAAGVSFESMKELARAAEKVQDHETASKYWKRVLELDAKDAEAWFGYGMAEIQALDGNFWSVIGDARFQKACAHLAKIRGTAA